MKVFISADIEGCGGVTLRAETHKGEIGYDAAARQMTDEVLAVCEGAFAAGATEIVVKDGHGDSCNLSYADMPKGVSLIRGKSGHPYNMMFGLDESFDAVIYVGYHAEAGNAGSPLSHTSTGASNHILLNGEALSEFILNSYTALCHSVPISFLTGDTAICEHATRHLPNLQTYATKSCTGTATINLPRETILQDLKEKVKAALLEDFSKNHLSEPSDYEYIVSLKDLTQAYKLSFYPGVEQIDSRTLRLISKKYFDILVAHSFLVY